MRSVVFKILTYLVSCIPILIIFSIINYGTYLFTIAILLSIFVIVVFTYLRVSNSQINIIKF